MFRSRRALILASVYALPATAWVLFARAVVPSVIEAAYHGQSWPLLNRLFQRRAPHPLEHYLALWQTFWEALLLAWGFHLIVTLVVLRTGRGLDEESSFGSGSKRWVRTVDGGLIAWSLALLIGAVLSGARQDYVAFLEIWEAVSQGHDPWWVHKTWGYPLHAYGPLFNILAFPAAWNSLAPKLLFTLAYCLFSVILVKRSLAERKDDARTSRFITWGLLAWLASPFAWVEVAYYGHFDVLVGIACVAAVAWFLEGREVLSGASLAVGFLLKLIPIVIVPFFGFDLHARRVRKRFLAAALVPMFVGYAVSFWIWGRSTFRPFRFGYQRGSTLLSIFRYLRGMDSPLRPWLGERGLDAWSTPCVAVAGLVVWLICQRRRIDPATSATAAVLTTLLFYQVGFIQYQMIVFLLMAYWLSRYASVLATDHWLAFAIAGYFGWLTAFDLFYAWAGGVLHEEGPWGGVIEWVGLPTFLLGVVLLKSLLGWQGVAERVRAERSH